MKKKRILILIDWYLPGFKAGGPIKSVSSTVEYLKDEFDFLIITTDSDFGSTTPYDSVKADTWTRADSGVSIFYASKAFLNRKSLEQLITSLDFDVVYVNSFFSFYFGLLPIYLHKKGMIKTPLLLAPRGMLGAGALQLKSAKKKLFLFVSKILRLHKNIFWHATSEQEKQEIIAQFGVRARITTVPNLQFRKEKRTGENVGKKAGEVRFYFLSRISEKKNLHFAMQRLLSVRNAAAVTMDIFGPIEDEIYWEKCQSMITELQKKGMTINHFGAIRNEDVAERIASYHFLFLPTLNENYGHVIVESFSNGKPVLLSDQTPWRDLSKSNAGWDIPLQNIAKFEEVINDCIHMDEEAYRQMSTSALRYASEHCNSEAGAALTAKMFKELCS